VSEARAFDSPVEPRAGLSGQRERRWGLIGDLVGAAAGTGSFLVAWLVQGEPLHELSGSPYPPVFRTRSMMPLDYYFLAMLFIGACFLGAAVVIARRGRYPRSDGFGAVLLGAILTLLAGVIMFMRVWAIVHA
jgi:hypothetical protein